MSKNWHISRRTMLRGAGAALALPWLEAMSTGSALGAGATSAAPLRMGIFTVTGGTVIESWKPETTGRLTAPLPSILRPLERFKDDVLILSGLSHSGKGEGKLNAHQQCSLMHLTGAPKVINDGGKMIAGVSVDQAAAQAVGPQTYLPSLEIGYSNHETRYSFRTPDQMVPCEGDPKLVFERMFRGREPLVPNWNQRAASRAKLSRKRKAGERSIDRSVLDLVMEDAKSLQRGLGTTDRKKVDEYLHSVRAIEQRIEFLEKEALQRYADNASGKVTKRFADVPAAFKDGSLNYGELRREIGRDPEPHGTYLDLMAELMVLAFQTDTTRVVTLSAGSDGALFPGVVTVGFERHAHTLEHQGNARSVELADPIAREGCRQIHEWYTSVFARAVAKMKSIDEGGASLLDNTMMLYTSYMADGGHGRKDYPAMLVGNAQGTLKTGRHIAYSKDTPMSNLFVELLNRMGAEVTEFGESATSPNAAYNGRLPDLV